MLLLHSFPSLKTLLHTLNEFGRCTVNPLDICEQAQHNLGKFMSVSSAAQGASTEGQVLIPFPVAEAGLCSSARVKAARKELIPLVKAVGSPEEIYLIFPLDSSFMRRSILPSAWRLPQWRRHSTGRFEARTAMKQQSGET